MLDNISKIYCVASHKSKKYNICLQFILLYTVIEVLHQIGVLLFVGGLFHLQSHLKCIICNMKMSYKSKKHIRGVSGV